MPHPFCLIADTAPQVTGHRPQVAGWLLLFVLVFVALPSPSSAAIPVNQLHRVELRSKPQFTRITLKLSNSPHYTITSLPNSRLRLRLHDTSGRQFKGLRRYSDPNIGGLVVRQRGSDLVVTFAVAAKGVGWRAVQVDGVPALSLDVGPLLAPRSPHPSQPGRERIWSGAEKLLRDFDPPIKPEIPFIPTDRQVLKALLNDEDQKLFLAAEGALYKGQLTAAEDAFTPFAARTGSAIRPLALYRLAETRYRLQRYAQALDDFRAAEQLWAEFLSLNPASMFYYGDSIARSGDLPGGRQLLARLVVAHADKKYAPILLVRMADVLARQGHLPEAEAIYRTVAGEFRGNKAHQIARMKLADQGFLQATPSDYLALTATYREAAEQAGDFDLREEATFKAMLLAAINAPARSALDEVVSFQKRFPRGVYASLIRGIREDLVDQTYQQGGWDRDPAGLMALADSNREYLAGVLRAPEFLPAVTNAFDKAGGRPLDLIGLFVGLLEQPWVGEANLPYLYLQVAEQSELLGDSLMAKKMLRTFLTRLPTDPQARLGRERLGTLQYLDGEMAEASLNLLWILNKGERAAAPVSYYYLGRALWQGKSYAQAALAMDLYLASAQGVGQKLPYIGDAYYVGAQARQSIGQYQQSLTLLEAGAKAVPADRRDQFLYKLGEVSLQDGKQAQARTYFEQLAKDGKDADWRRLATQSLQSLPASPSPPSKNQRVK